MDVSGIAIMKDATCVGCFVKSRNLLEFTKSENDKKIKSRGIARKISILLPITCAKVKTEFFVLVKVDTPENFINGKIMGK